MFDEALSKRAVEERVCIQNEPKETQGSVGPSPKSWPTFNEASPNAWDGIASP